MASTVEKPHVVKGRLPPYTLLVDNQSTTDHPCCSYLGTPYEGKPHANTHTKKLLANNGVSLLQRVARLVLHASFLGGIEVR